MFREIEGGSYVGAKIHKLMYFAASFANNQVKIG